MVVLSPKHTLIIQEVGFVKHIQYMCLAITLLVFSAAAVATPLPSVIDVPTETSLTEGIKLLSDSELLTVTGEGWFKRIGCAALTGTALGGGVVAGGALIVGATLPPVLAGGIIVAGIGAGICYFL